MGQTGFTPIRINAGGPTYTDQAGNVWTGSSSGGYSYAVSSFINNTSEPFLYQSEEWSQAPAILQHSFIVPNGGYRVTLKFAEIYFTGACAGQRVYDIVINGQTVQFSFDACAAAGGGNIAIDASYPVAVTNGQIVIQLIPIISNPKISAIEITSTPDFTIGPPSQSQSLVAGGTGATFTFAVGAVNGFNSQVTLSQAGLSLPGMQVNFTQPPVGAGQGQMNVSGAANVTPGSYNFTVTGSSTTGNPKSVNGTLAVIAPGQLIAPIRVNAGGPPYTDQLGRNWAGDTGGTTYTVSYAIGNTADPTIYQSERWSSTTLAYSYSVPNGNYNVTLKFAEIYFGYWGSPCAGMRVFNIVINGQTVQPSFDPCAAAGGPSIAVDKTYSIAVTGGQITVQLVPVVSDPKLSALEIVSVSPPAPPLLNPSSGSFAALGGTGQFGVTWNQNWTAVSSDPSWLTVSPASGTGNGTVSYSASLYTGPVTRTGTITVSGVQFAVTQNPPIAVPPDSLTMSPPTASGTTNPTTQVFQFSATDVNGAAFIQSMQVRFSAGTTGENACDFVYSRDIDSVSLLDNSATGFVTGSPAVLGSSAVLSNNQCSIAIAGSSSSAVGNTLTLTVNITFMGSFVGMQPVYLDVTDDSGQRTDWTYVGSWVAYPALQHAPSIQSVSPLDGAPGVQVTISGSAFGATRGSGNVWLGTKYGNVVSWSDTQIVAAVPPGSQSGTVQVQQTGLWSDPVSFSVANATITSVSPSTAVPGMQVTITGTSFGATQGTGQVWLGTTNAVVQSWSDTQIIAQVAAGSLSGKAQVLQAGVWSNAVTFNVSSLQIKSITPTSGTPGTAVTITGSGFGSSQGAGIVLLGSTTGQVVSWTDSQIIATVAPSSVSGVARVLQNGSWSNALTFTVPAGGNSMSLVPNIVTMIVGETRSLQALNSASQPVTGLTWTSSDTGIISLSTSDPPVLTAVAPGHATVTAGAASADITVYIDDAALPLGTVLWSIGSNATSIVPAVPSESGVADVFAMLGRDTVQAITDDGTIAWTADVSSSGGWVIPDFQGGLITIPASTDTIGITKLDGKTGQPLIQYNVPGDSLYSFVAHPDGTVFANVNKSQIGSDDDTMVVGIDPTTASEKFRIHLGAVGNRVSPLIVAGDGYAYMSYWYNDRDTANVHHKMLRVNSSGAYSIINILDWTAAERNLSPGLITNGDNGVVLTWVRNLGGGHPFEQHLTVVSNGVATDHVGPEIGGQVTNEPVYPVVQTQDGSFVGYAWVGDKWYPDTWVPYLVAFDQTGAIRWVVPNEQPQIATDDGGVIGTSGITYGQFGEARAQTALQTYSWIGAWYRSAAGSVQTTLYPALSLADSFSAFAQGNASANHAANRPVSKDVRQMIVEIARSYAYPAPSSQNWPDTAYQNQCNIFVKDVLKMAGLTPPISPNTPWYSWTRMKYYLGRADTPGYPAQSRDWANARATIKCWRAVQDATVVGPRALPAQLAIPGDIIAQAINYSDAFGHVGIVGGFHETVSADSSAPCVIGNGVVAGTIDISDFGFRADNWVDPLLCHRTSGKMKDAGVKTFACQ